MIQRAHAGHIGINSSVRRAKDLLFWPQMSADIRHYVETCGVCTTFADRQPAETIINTEKPTIPWTKAATDLFSWGGHPYLVLTDYTSGFFEIDHLRDTSADTIIGRLKYHFSRYGIPRVLISDNGPQFTSEAFHKFAKQWCFTHDTSSPYHSQGNGAAEAAVKTAKRIFRKCQASGEDPYLGILNLRNTPTETTGSSPVQKIFGRRTRTTIPMSDAQLASADSEAMTRERKTVKLPEAPTHKDLPDLAPGDVVRIQPTHGREWKEATVNKRLSSRSYDVTTNQGQHYRRNRRFIRKSQTPTHHQFPQGHRHIIDQNEDKTENENTDTRQPESGKQPSAENGREDNNTNQKQTTVENTTRYGRVSRPPKRYGFDD